MDKITELFTKFNSIKHLPMNAPEDERLTELRQSFELGIDSIAGILSFETKGERSPYMDQVFELPKSFKNVLTQVEAHKATNPGDAKYQEQLIQFLNELISLSSDLNIYLKDRYKV